MYSPAVSGPSTPYGKIAKCLKKITSTPAGSTLTQKKASANTNNLVDKNILPILYSYYKD